MAQRLERNLVAAAWLAALALPACAQLTIRLDPELDDPGTHGMPARLGYARQNDKASGALQMALMYNLKMGRLGENGILEPYVALVLHDNAAAHTDAKALELGLRSTIGDLGSGVAYLLDGALSKKVDRAVGSKGYDARIAAELVDWRHLKHGLGYTKDQWGLFIRPKLGLYYMKTQETDAPLTAPVGSVAGAWLGLEADFFPSFSDRTKLTYKGKFSYDARASGERVEGRYRKHSFSAEYLLFNYINVPKGQPQFSLLLNRSLGADPLDGAPVKKATTGIYLGIKL
jgi:hypothetical protein